MSTGRVDPEAIAAVIRGVGLQPEADPQNPLLQAALRLHENAARLRELDLWGVEPAIVFRLVED